MENEDDKFLTEKEIEGWLVAETRDLPYPDGTLRPLTGQRLWWEWFDYVATGSCTPQNIVKHSLAYAKSSGQSMEQSFWLMVKAMGEDLAAVDAERDRRSRFM